MKGHWGTEARFALLGPVSVDGSDGPIVLGSPKQRTVLAALLLNVNSTVSDDRLVALTWGAQPPRTAITRLRVYVHELRAVLGKDRIRRLGAGYRIRAEDGELDLELFERHRTAARAYAEAGRHADAVPRLRAAAALWRGPALAGTSATLIEQERPGLEDRRVCALEELYDSELALGRHAEVVGELHTAVIEYPLHERLLGQLMLALHRCERRADALAVYRDARQRLVDELGIEPGQALRRLHQQLLTDEPGSPAKGVGPDAPSERPPLPPPPEPVASPTMPVAARPAELPRDVRGFIAREAELAWLEECLGGGDGVCVLSGTAGMGKTALALHWAHQAADRFPDGQLYIDLRGYDPDHEPLTTAVALTRLLVSLGVDPDQAPGGFEARLGLYRSLLARRSFLLLLDNARSAAQVEPLLPPAGAVLVTSRHRLSELVVYAGARQRSLGPLPVESGRALVDRVLGPAGSTAESARRGEMVRLCGGLPLALRIAAANAAVRPEDGAATVVAELAAGNVLAGLTVDGAGRNAVTLAFSVSYRALAPADQRVFRLLGLVPGPDHTVAATAAVCGLPQVEARASLDALAAAHLLEHHAIGRYRFHDLVRLYAAAQAGRDPEREAAWNRLLGHCLEVGGAIAARGGLDEFRFSGSEPLADIRAEPLSHAAADVLNLMAALRRAIESDPGPEAWRLADLVRVICTRTGRLSEWLEIAPSLLEAASGHEVPTVHAMLHTSMGEALFRIGCREDAIGHLEQGARISLEADGREGEAAARVQLSFAHTWTGRLSEAMADTARAARLFHELGSISGQNHTLNALANHHFHLGRLDLAEQYGRQALALSRRHRLVYAEGADLRNLGAVLLVQGRYGEAENCLRESADLLASLGGHGIATTHTWISRLHWERGRWKQSREAALLAVDLARGHRDRLVEAAALVALADAGLPIGLTAEAEDSLNLADELITVADLRWHLAYSLAARARLRSVLGDHEGAVHHALKGRDVSIEASFRLPELAALTELAVLERRRGEHEAAARMAAQALRLCREIGHAPCEDKLVPFLQA
ncbi:BTAD domain-containing putative transcriptional regulator [Nonomuraea sp. NPDC005501]|uniref:AfsR/SARP family transcriptional regulator n=1 Tax=Nonomuraea sp. NPDC005501 TaxID=3156884 RepID=UPI0033B748A8